MSFFPNFRAESRATLALAVPIMAGQVSQMIMGLLDSAMVGRVGVLPLAASAFANNIVSVPFVFGLGLLTCLSVRASQSHGAGENAESSEVLRHGMALAAFCGLALTFLVWLLSFRLDRFGQSPEVVSAARPFMLLLGLSITPALLALGFKQFCEALNDPWPPTVILLAAVPINALLNWVFIYGNLGFSPQGLTGAGYATLIARTLSFLAIGIYIFRAPKIRPSLPQSWTRAFDVSRFASLLRIGIPASLQILLEVGAFATGAILVGWLGKDALAAHQIALSCAATTFMLPLGLAVATSIRLGQVVGSGEVGRVRAIGNNSLCLSFGVMALTATLFWVFRRPIAGAFVDDEKVVVLASQLLLVAGLFQFADGLQVVAAGALRGLSDAIVPMVICFVAYWVVGIPAGYFAAFHLGWGALGIWSGFALGLTLVAPLLMWRFRAKTLQLERFKAENTLVMPISSVH